jgi:hypothetical protein
MGSGKKVKGVMIIIMMMEMGAALLVRLKLVGNVIEGLQIMLMVV